MFRKDFQDRHIGPNDEQIASMLRDLGMNSLEQFIEQVVPSNIAMTSALADALPPAVSEEAALAELRELANQNQVKRNLIGTGYYGTITPPVVLRNVLENPAWYTEIGRAHV